MRRILVSGGSRGLGLAFCRHHLARGEAVLAFARSATPEVEELAAQHGGRFVFAEFDLAAPSAARAAVDAAEERLGGLDVLINNAAVGQDALLAHMAEEEITRIVEVNVTATIRLTRQAVRRMILQRSGHVLNVSSIAAERGFPGLTVYAATKGALDAFTRSLARELGGSGVLVNAVAPGFFESEMSSVLSPRQLDSIRRRTPSGELATAEQVVAACDALLAPGANITGQVLAVDGGASAS